MNTRITASLILVLLTSLNGPVASQTSVDAFKTINLASEVAEKDYLLKVSRPAPKGLTNVDASKISKSCFCINLANRATRQDENAYFHFDKQKVDLSMKFSRIVSSMQQKLTVPAEEKKGVTYRWMAKIYPNIAASSYVIRFDDEATGSQKIDLIFHSRQEPNSLPSVKSDDKGVIASVSKKSSQQNSDGIWEVVYVMSVKTTDSDSSRGRAVLTVDHPNRASEVSRKNNAGESYLSLTIPVYLKRSTDTVNRKLSFGAIKTNTKRTRKLKMEQLGESSIAKIASQINLPFKIQTSKEKGANDLEIEFAPAKSGRFAQEIVFETADGKSCVLQLKGAAYQSLN